MKNEINKIRNAKAAGTSAVFQLVKPTAKFSYDRKNQAEYSIEASMIAWLIRDLCTSFHADIAKNINGDEMITEKQAYAIATKFCELDFTFGQFKSANAHYFEEESEESKALDTLLD